MWAVEHDSYYSYSTHTHSTHAPTLSQYTHTTYSRGSQETPALDKKNLACVQNNLPLKENATSDTLKQGYIGIVWPYVILQNRYNFLKACLHFMGDDQARGTLSVRQKRHNATKLGETQKSEFITAVHILVSTCLAHTSIYMYVHM